MSNDLLVVLIIDRVDSVQDAASYPPLSSADHLVPSPLPHPHPDSDKRISYTLLAFRIPEGFDVFHNIRRTWLGRIGGSLTRLIA